MSDWTPLRRELTRWQESGRVATLWLRDDDAETPSPALDSLLAMTAEHGVSVLVAIIPARADRALAERLRNERHVEAFGSPRGGARQSCGRRSGPSSARRVRPLPS